MGLESILLTRDPHVEQMLRPALEKLSIAVEVCRAPEAGSELLLRDKFDAVIVDCDDLDGGLRVLQGIRQGTSNKTSVAFAILNGTSTQKAFELGANFVLQKPISPLNAMRCFSAALGFMTRERRRYFRHSVNMPVSLCFTGHIEIRATATNVSEGGMAIQFRGALPKTGLAKIAFTLPGSSTSMELKGQIAWADSSGHAGIRFTEIPQSSREQLDRWLTEQFKRAEGLA